MRARQPLKVQGSRQPRRRTPDAPRPAASEELHADEVRRLLPKGPQRKLALAAPAQRGFVVKLPWKPSSALIPGAYKETQRVNNRHTHRETEKHRGNKRDRDITGIEIHIEADRIDRQRKRQSHRVTPHASCRLPMPPMHR